MNATGASIHASAVMCGELGILIRGPSGAGKSWLAHELIAFGESHCGFGRLIADDRVLLRRDGESLFAHVPAAIRGLLEIRGTGLVRVPCLDEGMIGLIVDLGAGDAADMQPCGVTLPRWQCANAQDALDLITTRLQTNIRACRSAPLAPTANGGEYTHLGGPERTGAGRYVLRKK